MPAPAAFVLVLVIALLLGSVPNGVIVGKTLYGVDIRERGSGNIGTTNALRSLGAKAGALVFALDFSKGLLAGLVGHAIFWLVVSGGGIESGTVFTYNAFVSVAFFGCVLGHIFSPWLGFKGGKGIAVAVGCLFVTFGPVGALIELASFIVVVALTRYVSAGSITAAALCPFMSAYYFLFQGGQDWLAWVLCTVAACAVLWAHRGNFERLRKGTESKLGAKE